MSIKSNTAKKKLNLKKSRKYCISLLFNLRRQKLHRTLRQPEDLSDNNRRIILNFAIGSVEDYNILVYS